MLGVVRVIRATYVPGRTPFEDRVMAAYRDEPQVGVPDGPPVPSVR
jgi:hypothetical protein